MAMRPYPGAIDILQSSDPANIFFSAIPGAKYAPSPPRLPDKPWVAVASVTNTDHICVGFNEKGCAGGSRACIRYSLDCGANRDGLAIEKTTPGAGFDLPAVRLRGGGVGQASRPQRRFSPSSASRTMQVVSTLARPRGFSFEVMCRVLDWRSYGWVCPAFSPRARRSALS